MEELQYTLLSDGSADKALMPILNWLLRLYVPRLPIQSHWADLRLLRKPPQEFDKKIRESIRIYPCDLLFVHRDAEAASLQHRQSEIRQAVEDARADDEIPITICVVPTRMTEAWLLFDSDAIRQAAGNPNGTVQLNLPSPSSIERLPDPKRVLHDLLRDATEKGTRRRKNFRPNTAVQLIPKYIKDFSPLRRLSAFVALEEAVQETIESQHWGD
ncbi:MAG: hypothetical protein JRJ51_26005 [Deltaproteobacteria bacterium]|nr:hypothetical protein [Deltaproteobacteria bacterium]